MGTPPPTAERSPLPLSRVTFSRAALAALLGSRGIADAEVPEEVQEDLRWFAAASVRTEVDVSGYVDDAGALPTPGAIREELLELEDHLREGFGRLSPYALAELQDLSLEDDPVAAHSRQAGLLWGRKPAAARLLGAVSDLWTWVQRGRQRFLGLARRGNRRRLPGYEPGSYERRSIQSLRCLFVRHAVVHEGTPADYEAACFGFVRAALQQLGFRPPDRDTFDDAVTDTFSYEQLTGLRDEKPAALQQLMWDTAAAREYPKLRALFLVASRERVFLDSILEDHASPEKLTKDEASRIYSAAERRWSAVPEGPPRPRNSS